MLVTFRDLPKVTFPAFILPSDDWYITDGVLFFDGRVVDEKNMPGSTLGIRRIQCRRKDLYPLKKAVFNLPQLIQCKTKCFIDNKGKAFVYMKTYRSKLKCYRIKRIDRKEIHSLMWLKDVPFPITIERPPLDNYDWVRMLHYEGEPWLVYDYVRSPTKDTYRRV